MLLRRILSGFGRRRSTADRGAEGLAAWAAGDFARAEAAFREAIAAGSADPAVLHGLGSMLVRRGQMDEGVASLRLATEAAPDNPGYWVALGKACASGGLAEEGADALETALRLKPDLLEIEALLHKPLLDGCKWDRVAELAQRLTERARSWPAEVWTRALDPWVALALPIEPSMRREAARQHARRVAARVAGLPRPQQPVRERRERLRIGYLSADFHAHATGYLAAGLFEHHDRDRFETFAYSLGRDDESVLRRRLAAAFDRFQDLPDATIPEIAQQIADDGIDILVDLKGYTTNARPEVLALRPAPVQAQYLGFPGSMQAEFVDYIIADAVVAPPADADQFSEAIARLPGSYQANDDRQPIAAGTPARGACGLPERGFVFCCFNQNFKIEPGVFAAWMRILAAVPGSVLWLFRSTETAQARLRAAAAAAGVDQARLVFAGWMAKPEHLARQRLADLFLDTHTCNAHTTASDALWAGLPLLTWPGPDFAGRVSASLLRAIGLPELIVPDLQAYERTAVALAAAPERLREVRTRLAANRTTMPLFRTAELTRGIERAYERMWATATAGRLPETFDLE